MDMYGGDCFAFKSDALEGTLGPVKPINGIRLGWTNKDCIGWAEQFVILMLCTLRNEDNR